jgi:hypothetical protein
MLKGNKLLSSSTVLKMPPKQLDWSSSFCAGLSWSLESASVAFFRGDLFISQAATPINRGSLMRL